MAISTVYSQAQGVVPAQKGDKSFTLEDLNFGGNNYRNMVAKNRWCTWWGDQLVRQDIDACYLVNKKNGKETKLFGLDDINKWIAPTKDIKVRTLYNAKFPFAGKSIVKVSNGSKTYYVDWKKKKCVREVGFEEGENLLEANAQQNAFAYLKDNNLYVITAHGKSTQLSTDGSRSIVYGQSVHRDEFGISKGTFWSPDGNRLAFYRMDQSMVTDYPQVNIPEIGFNHPETQSCIATAAPDKYPMAGETSHKVTVGVYDMARDTTVYLKTGDPTDRYFTGIQWSPDGKSIYMFELNRRQNDCRLADYDATTGKRKGEIYRETSDKYVEPLNPVTFVPWSKNLMVLQSQRDGYNHLYIYNEKGEEVTQLTKGNFVVERLVGFNAKDKRIIIESNELGPLQRNLYAVDYKSGRRTLLDNGRGMHRAQLSESGQWLADRYTEPGVPRNIDLTSTVTGKRQRLFTASDPWQGYTVPTYECGTIKAADGTTDLYYRMVKPANFDATKKYPTIVYVYGGPHAHQVNASWHYGSRSWDTYMAQKGYIVFSLDNRGSERRGRDFEQVTFHQLGKVEMEDQMKGVDFLKSLPYVDASRLGVHGWSFGGFMTISLMTHHPDIFKVGVAGGPVIDWKWYEVMYGERYMGTPQDNPKGYEASSLLGQARNLKGKLQIIIGMNDPVVVPQNALQFLNACAEAGTQPDFFAYPGEGHNMMGHKSVHLHERITQYFEDYLKPIGAGSAANRP